MTIKDAIRELLESDKFKENSRTDAKLRVFRQRFNEGHIGNGAAVTMLINYGYKIDINKGTVSKPQKSRTGATSTKS